MKVLITGGTNGMGKGVAKALADYPGEKNVILLVIRSEKLGLQTMDEIKTDNPLASISMVVCDLCEMNSVKRAALEIKTKHDFIDSIFINAGIGYASCRVETIDGMDSHFQVNYLSQFYLVAQLLELLEKSTKGGRVIYNATPGGKMYWDDMQMIHSWNYVHAIQQAMVAKRMLLITLHDLYKNRSNKVSFIGFSIHKTVWSNQLNIIPTHMRIAASVMRALGTFISIEECGKTMAPLFMENANETLARSGCLLTWKNNHFEVIEEDNEVKNKAKRKDLLDYSMQQCKNGSVEAVLGTLAP
jgi:NAD(P)-dependent dehydrogenase (short-subunit alcohol dehydrogenase family)